MKNLICLLTLVALSTAFFAQAPTQESKVRIILDKNENGVVTKMDTTFELTNSVDIKEVLQQYGIDADIDIDGEKGSTQVMRFEMHIDDDKDGSDVDVNRWIDKDGQVQIEMDATKHIQVLDGSVMELLENMEDIDEETREEVRKALENLKVTDEENGTHKGVKIIRFERNEDMDDVDGENRVMMFRSKDGDMQLEDIDIDDVVQVDVRKMKNSDENGVEMIREIRVVIKLEDINDEDKTVLKRAGAPVAPSIDESLQLDNLVFYPNPNDGRFRLRFNAPNEGDVNLRVVNMEGKTLYSKNLPAFSGHYDDVISIEDQAAGAYLLSISQNGQTVNKKLVKQ